MTDWQKDYFACQYAASGSKLHIRGIYQTQWAARLPPTRAAASENGHCVTLGAGSGQVDVYSDHN